MFQLLFTPQQNAGGVAATPDVPEDASPASRRGRGAPAGPGRALPPARGRALLTDGGGPVREQQGPRPAPGGGCGRLGPRMSSADHHHVEVRSAGRRAVPAARGRRPGPPGEGAREPAAATSEREHGGRKAGARSPHRKPRGGSGPEATAPGRGHLP